MLCIIGKTCGSEFFGIYVPCTHFVSKVLFELFNISISILFAYFRSFASNFIILSLIYSKHNSFKPTLTSTVNLQVTVHTVAVMALEASPSKPSNKVNLKL